MIEQPTFVDQAFRTSGGVLDAATKFVTSPVQKVYDSLNRDGGSLDMLKRHAFKMFRLRAPKMRSFHGRPLQHV